MPDACSGRNLEHHTEGVREGQDEGHQCCTQKEVIILIILNFIENLNVSINV